MVATLALMCDVGFDAITLLFYNTIVLFKSQQFLGKI